MYQANFHKTKDPFWTDESGIKIPANRTTAGERLKERKSASIYKKAVSLHDKLKELKAYIKAASVEVRNEVYKETGTEPKENAKGNFTWYNFDRSVKIEANVSEPIDFDDLLIQAAREKLDEFLKNNITSKNEFVKDLVLDAFKTSRGKLDTKRVLNLTRYKDKVNEPLFREAVDLINKAIRRKPSRMYFRVWAKDDNGKYQNIDLNFSSIEL
jgi:hypothetical protein